MNQASNVSCISSFENKVRQGLGLCGVDLRSADGLSIGAAVSGGADSMSLLYSLARILSPLPLHVLTVNHFIRPEEETSGDARFVVDACQALKNEGFNVSCSVTEFEPGEVFKLARSRKAGVEEAARVLRYEAFDNFISENNIDFLCLAHNKNDQLETVLMRFLQGSNADASGGIKIAREKFIRPLLNISRSEIEDYMNALGKSWREDKTNGDTNYFRNNVRHNLIPFLSQHFPGWEKAVLSGAVKAGEDADVINERVLSFDMNAGRGKNNEIISISFNKNDFLKEKPGVQKRILMKACNLCGENSRISNVFLEDFIKSLCFDGQNNFSKFYGEIEICVKKDLIFVKKHVKKDTDLVFFDIIEEDGVYDFPFGKIDVTFSNSTVYFSVNGCGAAVKTQYPVCIRNYQQGDDVVAGNGCSKKIADIFSDWHVIESDRRLIPIIYNLKDGPEKIKCVLGSFLGYKDWIVR